MFPGVQANDIRIFKNRGSLLSSIIIYYGIQIIEYNIRAQPRGTCLRYENYCIFILTPNNNFCFVAIKFAAEIY